MENTTNQQNNDPTKNFKLIESTKKIFYFSKLSLDFDNCKTITKFIKTVKENILKATLEPINYFVQGKYNLTIKYRMFSI